MIGQIFIRDLRLAMRRPGDVISTVGFFLMIATLFPLAIGPDSKMLALMTSSILWIAVLLASLPSFDRLFVDDYHTGFLDRLVISNAALWICACAYYQPFLHYGTAVNCRLAHHGAVLCDTAICPAASGTYHCCGIICINTPWCHCGLFDPWGAACLFIISYLGPAFGLSDCDIWHISKPSCVRGTRL